MALSNTFIDSFPSKRNLHWRENKFHSKSSLTAEAVSEEARENTMFLGRTLDYTSERLEESLRKFLLREDGLLTGLMYKCEVLKAFLG